MHRGFPSFCECVCGSPFCRSFSALHRGTGCVQPPPAATDSQESRLLGRPCQLRTPVPAGGPYLQDQAAPSVFARGGVKGETEALQSALAMVTRRWWGPGQL